MGQDAIAAAETEEAEAAARAAKAQAKKRCINSFKWVGSYRDCPLTTAAADGVLREAGLSACRYLSILWGEDRYEG